MLLLGVLQAQAAGAPVGAGSFDLLETQVLASSAASVTFSSLSTYAADYQHLQIRAVARTNRGSELDNLSIRLNGDTAANYSWHQLAGEGSVVFSSGGGSANAMTYMGIVNAASVASTIFGATVFDILDPYETTKYPTIRSLTGAAGGSGGFQLALRSGSWRNTASLTSINIFSQTGSSLVTGSRFSLYGIKAGA